MNNNQLKPPKKSILQISLILSETRNLKNLTFSCFSRFFYNTKNRIFIKSPQNDPQKMHIIKIHDVVIHQKNFPPNSLSSPVAPKPRKTKKNKRHSFSIP